MTLKIQEGWKGNEERKVSGKYGMAVAWIRSQTKDVWRWEV